MNTEDKEYNDLVEAATAEWEKNAYRQLRHIAVVALQQSERLRAVRDPYGNPYPDPDSELTLKTIEACIARIRAIRE
jgi:hypothetical protein